MTKTGRHIKTDFNFLLFFDFSSESYKALDYLIKLVKVIGGSIEMHVITEPKDIIKSENTVAALRSIEENSRTKKKKLESITEMIQLEEIPASYTLSIGRLEEELKAKLNTATSSIAVIGHSKSRTIQKATKYLTKKFNGSLLIINPNLELNGTLSKTEINSESIPLNGKVINFKPAHIDIKINIELFKEALNDRNIELNCIKRKRINSTFIKRLFNYNKSIQAIIETSTTPLLITPNN